MVFSLLIGSGFVILLKKLKKSHTFLYLSYLIVGILVTKELFSRTEEHIEKTITLHIAMENISLNSLPKNSIVYYTK